MNISAKVTDERVCDVRCDAANLNVGLMDGRTMWEKCGGGYGFHWPELDEDLSTEGLLRGAPAARAA